MGNPPSPTSENVWKSAPLKIQKNLDFRKKKISANFFFQLKFCFAYFFTFSSSNVGA